RSHRFLQICHPARVDDFFTPSEVVTIFQIGKSSVLTGQLITAEIRFCTAIKGNIRLKQRIKVEIIGKDSFWERAFHVEWESQFSNRKLATDGEKRFLADADWLTDLERVAGETFCTIRLAPQNPRRREWIGSLI